MRVLITGVTGMTGSHLAEIYLANHPEVHLFGGCVGGAAGWTTWLIWRTRGS